MGNCENVDSAAAREPLCIDGGGTGRQPGSAFKPFVLAAALERIHSSLFFTPMLFVLAGIVIGQITVSIDVATAEGASQLPLGFTSTVESARAVVSTIAAATISVAGIAFSISLLVIQLASSQYSPRVVHSLFRDPTNKRLMGIVVGTFSYCLVVLRSVRDRSWTSASPSCRTSR